MCYYKVMPFRLKNARATYQKLVNEMFKDQIEKTMKVYIDDMLVKSKVKVDRVQHISNTFEALQKD